MLKAYTNADRDESIDEIKKTSGGELFLGDRLDSQICKKQASVSLSIAKAKYIALTFRCTRVLWMKQTVKDIKVVYDEINSYYV